MGIMIIFESKWQTKKMELASNKSLNFGIGHQKDLHQN